MKILVLNCGSSSVKFKFINVDGERVLASGIVERIPSEHSPDNKGALKYQAGDDKYEQQHPVADHTDAIRLVIDALTDKENFGVIEDKSEVSAVGHRLVHGAETFVDSVLIDDLVVAKLNDCIKFAPLHNPPNIKGVLAAREIFGDIPMVGVFDTAFHQTMPREAFLYGLPLEYYETQRIRRYGFHGTSHAYVARVAAQITRQSRRPEELRVITCHLGNGSSIAAICGGESQDTSMGFTPLEGVLMGTRSGDMDPAIPLLLQGEDFGGPRSADEVDTILNKRSGLKGISGVASDFRELHDLAAAGDERAALAIKIYCYRVRKYIGSYMAVLGGVDCLVFTAGVGENDDIVRRQVCQNMEDLGIVLDLQKNDGKKREVELISTPESKVEIWVIPTNEELVIARDTQRVIGELGA